MLKTEEHIIRLESNIQRLELDLDAYKKFLNGTYESLLINDKEMKRKAQAIKDSGGFNMLKDDLLRSKIEELEDCVKNANAFEYTRPESQ